MWDMGSVITAAKVISEPVPAVVGIANNGVPAFLDGRIPVKLARSPGLVRSIAVIFAASRTDPPPTAIIASQFSSRNFFSAACT